MKTQQKLEIFRTLYCLGLKDVEEAFKDSDIKDHLSRKYLESRKEHGHYGNFAFLLSLDNKNASLLLSKINF